MLRLIRDVTHSFSRETSLSKYLYESVSAVCVTVTKVTNLRRIATVCTVHA